MKILVLTGHPRGDSFCAAIAERYATAAERAGHQVRRVKVSEIDMDFAAPDFSVKDPAAQADWVRAAQADIAWSEHVVTVTPMWWGGTPARLKNYFDRVLLPGFALRYLPDGKGYKPLLKGRTARVIVTGDTPWIFLRWIYGKPIVNQLVRQIFGFCGFSPVRTTYLGPVVKSTPQSRSSWLARIEALGAKAA